MNEPIHVFKTERWAAPWSATAERLDFQIARVEELVLDYMRLGPVGDIAVNLLMVDLRRAIEYRTKGDERGMEMITDVLKGCS